MPAKSQKTEDQIKAAVVNLLQTRSFEQITISDITRQAHINRGTFYLHYLDKYDLLNHYETDLYTRMEALCTELAGKMTYETLHESGVYSHSVVSRIVELVAGDFALIQALFGPNGDPKFEPKTRQIVQGAIGQAIYRIKGTHQLTPTIPTEYAWELTLSGLFDIIKCWLRQPHPEPPTVITNIIMKTRFMSPLELLGLEEFAQKK